MTVAEQGKGGQVRLTRLVLVGAAMVVLAGCEEGAPSWLKPDSARQSSAEGAAPARTSVKLVERDVEAPDVFQVTDMGLWDGRPSLGGVWVAHPDVKEPERVIIRSTADSKFVIGALFRRARDIPGPALQVSSDAAAALGMLAGAPVQLNVTALRREEAKEETPEPEAAPDAAVTLAAPADIEATALEPVAGAAAAIDAAEAAEAAAPAPQTTAAAAPNPTPAAAPTPAPARTSSLDKPFIQIGIFSVEENARNTATAMRQAGMVPTVLEQNSQGKAFWRVIVGPATNASERAALLKKIQGIGFEDAYAVTN
ncbi:MAG: SPOR domain-containing protein [Roseovarius sp.]|uniref:SPOR domain-containing protein n=1 Tax=Roseovarius sp. TaxID=1486281 RepID=UPI001B6CD45B|nr:SPOR domain-containing protein [Roseovarius sp.]MBQ0750534.1 SPOR domain-containing protein [Roseovarius sp.]MBQ0809337.1 SPOR domain-containing protein [Roseovarius sp.]